MPDETTAAEITEIPSSNFEPYYNDPRINEVIAPILFELLGFRAEAVMVKLQKLPFIGVGYFKKVLAEELALTGGKLFADVIFHEMVRTGQVEVYKIKTSYTDRETTALRKPEAKSTE